MGRSAGRGLRAQLLREISAGRKHSVSLRARSAHRQRRQCPSSPARSPGAGRSPACGWRSPCGVDTAHAPRHGQHRCRGARFYTGARKKPLSPVAPPPGRAAAFAAPRAVHPHLSHPATNGGCAGNAPAVRFGALTAGAAAGDARRQPAPAARAPPRARCRVPAWVTAAPVAASGGVYRARTAPATAEWVLSVLQSRCCCSSVAGKMVTRINEGRRRSQVRRSHIIWSVSADGRCDRSCSTFSASSVVYTANWESLASWKDSWRRVFSPILNQDQK